MQRVVLVTGASSGIGWSVARHLAGKGFKTAAGARRLEKMAPLRDDGVHPFRLDVSNSDSIDACLSAVRRDLGEIDVLVNNAGIELMGPAELVPISDGRRLFDVNFFGLVEMTRKCLPHMREQRWGRIVNVSSIGGVTTQPYNGWYHASKYAAEGFTRSLRQEVAQFGVSASTIRPGAIESEVFDSIFAEHEGGERWNEDYRESIDSTMRLMQDVTRRAADPLLVAKAVHRAISDRHPRLSYTTPLLARLIHFCMRYLLTESFGNRVTARSFGLKDEVGTR